MKLLAKLPAEIQKAADDAFETFKIDPARLQFKELKSRSKARMRERTYSVRVTLKYRALCVIDQGPDNEGPEHVCWYWIGSHSDYDNFLGSN